MNPHFTTISTTSLSIHTILSHSWEKTYESGMHFLSIPGCSHKCTPEHCSCTFHHWDTGRLDQACSCPKLWMQMTGQLQISSISSQYNTTSCCSAFHHFTDTVTLAMTAVYCHCIGPFFAYLYCSKDKDSKITLFTVKNTWPMLCSTEPLAAIITEFLS